MKWLPHTTWLLAFFLCSVPVAAQRHETFAERPAKRQEKARSARERADREREEAIEWARARGLRTRFEEADGRASELIAIRDGRPVYNITMNGNAAISTAASPVRQAMPFGADGSGFKVGVWDKGPGRASHQEFGGRLVLRNGGTTSSHATHVCGTIGAAGIDAGAKGMAPGVLIDSYDWDGAESEMIAAAAAAPGNTDRIHLSNHSYGIVSGWVVGSYSGTSGYHWYGNSISDRESAYFGQYGDEARYWDDIVHDAPYFLPFKSAGNDRDDAAPTPGTIFHYYSGGWQSANYNSSIHPLGDGVADGGYDTIGPRGNAKNIMTVGSVRDAVSGGLRHLPGATMEGYSGWGPADDGRVKPDIVANGYALRSTESASDTAYGIKSGTSMSSPNACGSAVLLVDYYAQRFPGGAMRASTLKGLIIHTADDLGRPGPDYQYGWGLMNTLAAAELIRDHADGNALRMTEALLHASTNTSDTYTFFTDGFEPVRATLCWTDPPGTKSSTLDDRTPRLVNDLDLKITGPDGIHHPYSLDYANPAANATADSKNSVDNVEQVFIAAPAPGTYTITVDHAGTLSGGQQWYSLLVSGVAADSDENGIPDYWENTYFGGLLGALAGADADGDGASNLAEYIAGTDPTNPASVLAVTGFQPPPAGAAAPFILDWSPVEGRIYEVKWTDNLIYAPFTGISGDLPYPAHSYTDTVERAGAKHYYRVDVRLGE